MLRLLAERKRVRSRCRATSSEALRISPWPTEISFFNESGSNNIRKKTYKDERIGLEEEGWQSSPPQDDPEDGARMISEAARR